MKRTFVFISAIPPSILEPLDAPSSPSGSRQAKYSLEYERLRRLLVKHTSGVMLAMHLGASGKPFGLALYASEAEAIQACKATITTGEKESTPLRLRILTQPKPKPREAVYSSTIVIDGEEVEKSTLATTKGLELAFRSQAIPQWCPQTLRGEDCPFGVACQRIHKAAVQVTVRKRRRDVAEGMLTQMSSTETQALSELFSQARGVCLPILYQTLVPPTLRLPGMERAVSVALEAELVQQWLLGSSEGDTAAAEASVIKAVKAAVQGSALPPPYFLRLNLPGGAPWDAALWEEEGGSLLAQLRHECPFPSNGAPTPLERDEFLQRLLYWLNRTAAAETVESGVKAVRCSPRVKAALRHHLQEQHSSASAIRKSKSEDGAALSSTSTVLYLSVLPWVPLPCVAAEATYLTGDLDESAVGVVLQRKAHLRSMTSCALLAKAASEDSNSSSAVNAALGRVAVLGRGSDAEAEEAMEAELQAHGRALLSAAVSLRRHLQATVAAARQEDGSQGASFPPHAAFAVDFVMVPTLVSSTGSSGQARPQHLTPKVLGFRPLARAMDESLLSSMVVEQRLLQSTKGEVVWNTKRHSYEPLLPRAALLRLKKPGDEEISGKQQVENPV